VGKLPLDVQTQPIDLLSLSAHKLHGPQGVGALYIREGVKIASLIHGGGQERGLRSATENVVGIVGLGQAAEIARAEMSEEAARLVRLRDRIIETGITSIPNAYVIGHRHRRDDVAHAAHNADGDLVMQTKGLQASRAQHQLGALGGQRATRPALASQSHTA
jgi:cysteine desulfurase